MPASEREKVRRSNLEIMSALALVEAVGARGGGHAFAHPEDPGVGPAANLWVTPEVMGVETRLSSERTLPDVDREDGLARGGICLSGNL